MQEPCKEYSGVKSTLNDHERRLNTIEEAIVEIRDRLLGRPTWLVTFLFGAMSSIIIALVILLLKSTGG